MSLCHMCLKVCEIDREFVRERQSVSMCYTCLETDRDREDRER